MADRLFERICLVGLGLIGSSLARRVRRDGLAGHVSGHARSRATRERALGLCDSVHDTAQEAARDADLVVLCAPVGAFAAVTREIAPVLRPGAIVSDVGSVKAAVIADVGPLLPEGVHFIPAHPVAGTEESGPDAGFATLFDGRWCILTPPPGADPAAIEALASFWRACGSRVEAMDPVHHDRVLAVTSHMPHLVAYALVSAAAAPDDVSREEVIRFSAGGFRDFTRIAASDPAMWRDVFLANADAVLRMLDRFDAAVSALREAVRRGDGPALFEAFARTRDLRGQIIAAGQEAPEVDFGRRPASPPGDPRRTRWPDPQ